MYFSTPNFKRITLILLPCAAFNSFTVNGDSNMNGTSDDHKKLLESKKTAVVMLASDGCGHCKTASPHFKAIAEEMQGENIDFLKLKSSENSDIMNEYELDGVPAFLYIKDGKVQNKDMGFESKEKLQETIRNHAAQADSVETSDDSSVEMPDDVSMNVDTAMPVQEAPAYEEGILAKIQALFMGLFNAIKHVFVSIFDWIKGLFNK